MQYADELAPAADAHFADAQIQREDLAVLAQAAQFALADAQHARLPALDVAREMAVVFAAVGLGHQHADVAPEHFALGVAEYVFHGGIARLHQAGVVDGDHPVHQVVRNRRGTPALVVETALQRQGAAQRP